MQAAGNFDVIVAGAGLAGYTAAIAASDEGASVLLIEKMPESGGSTVWSGGAFCLAGTEEQAAAGISDDAEGLRTDLINAGPESVDPALVDLYVQRQHEIYIWLKQLGVVFSPPVLSPGQSLPRSHGVDPRSLIRRLHDVFIGRPNCKYQANSEVLRIDRDHRGVARIVHVFHGGETCVETAAKGVVLCTGGFARNKQLLLRYAPKLGKAKPIGGQGLTGDGIKIGMALGADLTDFGWLEGTSGTVLPNYPSWDDNESKLLHAIYAGAILLNREGRRFVNESLSYRKMGDYVLAQPGAVAFQLFDQTIMDASQAEPVTRDYKSAYEKGLIKRAESISEAAKLMGLPSDAVEEEVAAYNRGIDEGNDAFGRRSLLSGQGKLVPLTKPPFYIYACTVGISSTFAGLVANNRMALLNVFGEEIPGLFVAGEIVGGFHGSAPVSGTSLAKAAIFGKTAGENVVRLAGYQ